MLRSKFLLFASVAMSSLTAPVFAQQDDGEGEAIIVTGQVQRGAILVDTPPEVSLTRGDLNALAATSLSDMLGQLNAQTGGGRGDGSPVVLLNGKRISSFSEIRDIPQEAVIRVDIFPPEVALRYGYRATERVVNVVLRPRFSAVQNEATGGTTTDGGRDTLRAQTGLLRIRNDGRTSLDAQVQHQSALYEDRRDIPQEATPDNRPFRSLLSRADSASLNGTIARPLSQNVSGALNARTEVIDSRAGLGIDGTRPLLRDSLVRSGHAGLTLAGKMAAWQWTLTSNFDMARSASQTDRAGRTDRDRATSLTRSAGLGTLAVGPLFELPAGRATTSLGFDAGAEGISSRSTRLGIVGASRLSRETVQGQVTFDLPVASRSRGVLPFLGRLSVNANLAARSISGVGTLATWGYGAAWTPLARLNLSANYTREEDAPTLPQLGNPVVTTPNVRIFDLVRGETVTASRIDGGNPQLRPDDSRIVRLGLVFKPIPKTDLGLVANFTDELTGNAILSFPLATASLEAAFPARFVRDVGGRLTTVDSRPLNVAAKRQRKFRWGINFAKRFGPAPLQVNPLDRVRESETRAGNAPGQGGEPPRDGSAPGGNRSGGPPRGMGGGGRAPRVQLAVYHSLTLRDDVQLGPGQPRLDLLAGDSIGSQGGSARHRIEMQGGFTKNGLGIRASANWQSPTTVRDAAGPLRFGSLATVDLRLFANLGMQPKLVQKHDWLRGTQIFIGINNLFDARQRVSDANGATPLGYLPDRLDPQGRSIRITFRKLFSSFRPGMPQPVAPPRPTN